MDEELARVLLVWWLEVPLVSHDSGREAALEDMKDLLSHLNDYGYEIKKKV